MDQTISKYSEVLRFFGAGLFCFIKLKSKFMSLKLIFMTYNFQDYPGFSFGKKLSFFLLIAIDCRT